MAGGRPTKYQESYCEAVVRAGVKGYSLTAFAGQLRVSRDTISEWMNVHPEFSAACRVHGAVRTLALEKKMLTTDIGPRVTAMMFALKNAAPQEFREKQTIEANVNMTIADLVAASYKPPALIEHKKDEDEES